MLILTIELGKKVFYPNCGDFMRNFKCQSKAKQRQNLKNLSRGLNLRRGSNIVGST